MTTKLIVRLPPLAAAALAAAVLGLAAAAIPAARAAEEPKLIGAFDAWTAFTYAAGAGKLCYIASEPTKQQGKYTKRGDVLALVTHSSADKTFDVVSFVAGYTYKPEGNILVKIGSEKFKLFTEADRAWASDEKTDKALVAAMRRGSRMVVIGTSSRGTRTTDTYSLLGFTKAYKKISAACGAGKKAQKSKKKSKKKKSKKK